MLFKKKCARSVKPDLKGIKKHFIRQLQIQGTEIETRAQAKVMQEKGSNHAPTCFFSCVMDKLDAKQLAHFAIALVPETQGGQCKCRNRRPSGLKLLARRAKAPRLHDLAKKRGSTNKTCKTALVENKSGDTRIHRETWNISETQVWLLRSETRFISSFGFHQIGIRPPSCVDIKWM